MAIVPYLGGWLWRLHSIETWQWDLRCYKENQNKNEKRNEKKHVSEENKLMIINWKRYQIINTYKGQTRTDTDKTDKTRQDKKMRVMICLLKQKSKGFLDITPVAHWIKHPTIYHVNPNVQWSGVLDKYLAKLYSLTQTGSS